MTKEDLYREKMTLVRHEIEHFMKKELFTWEWWFLLALSIIPWIVWLFVRDRHKQVRLLAGGLGVALIAVIADIMGTQAGFWYYGIKLLPSIPPLLPYDITLMPVSFMLIEQYAKNRKQWYIVAVLFSAFTAFAVESLLDFINIYHQVVWHHIYSWPLYFCTLWIGSRISRLKA